MSEKTLAEKISDSLRSPIIAALDGEGITIETLAKQLKRELKANETKHFAYQGIVQDQKDVEAWDIQQRARIDAHKLRGDYPAEEHRITGEMITSRSPEEIRDLQEIADRVVDEIRKGKRGKR